ncbi:TetR/AcrR family transcriptional regulator [Nitriliruptor alkaliphilus]|uniref:TetR/AcrR family transcriptional regulator n=1 Tax=Nitriliruptor alkaliphilus TaxID=427918 RepID=UPI0006981E90|nr:TetR/AcrR family transcriptional regulator [Nitriliruptor alkaliphilus]
MAARGRPRTFDRDAALAIAMEHFWERGYEGTSISDLTTAMAITPTSLYAAFGSKEALFREAVARYNAADTSPTDRALAADTHVRDAIRAVLRDNADAYVDPATPRGCMVVLAGTNLTTDNARIGRHLTELRHADEDKLRQRIQRAADEGQLSPAADVDALAAYVLTVLQGLAVQARDGCTRAKAHAIVDHAMAGWDRMAHDA